MKQKFVIEGRLASLNDYILACRKSPFAGNHFKHEQQDKVNKAILKSNLSRISDSAVRVLFFFYEQNKKRDLDNISGWAHKSVMDALVTSGILDNDGWKQVAGYEDHFYVDKENPRIEVILETVDKQ